MIRNPNLFQTSTPMSSGSRREDGAPRPEPQPAPPVVELMDAPPLAIRRPVTLVDGMAYAAAWPFVKITRTETKDQKTGQIIKHDPPLIEQEQRLIIVRSDGMTFGEGGKRPLAELGFGVALPEIPPQEKLWRAFAVRSYTQGQRPDPADVFGRIVDVIDRFIDFDKSTASQREMYEFVACYIMASWFLDAFNIAGFVWPNGQAGSGKTQLLSIIGSLGYLGQVILAGGSYASLRDLADYGAMLCFDDAENLSDPKQSDPDKRALLLAGNRRGNTVPIKVPGPDRTWRTRHVSTYCPRAFSAIRLPDNVLASRSIIVPLIRTADRSKANADPMDETLWPNDRRQLADDLWALSLSYLSTLPPYDRRVGQEATLVGRNLEPWRSLLAVALWLNESKVEGLWQRMNSLSERYQAERQTLESSDQTTLVIRALWKCFEDSCAIVPSTSADMSTFVTTKEVTETAKAIAIELEADVDPEKLTSRTIGRILSKLRLTKVRPDGSKGRGWKISGSDLQKRMAAFGLTDTQKVMAQTAHDGTTAHDDGTSGQATTEMVEIRLGEAIWHAHDGDRPVTVIGDLSTQGGQRFVAIEGSKTGIPLDEIEYIHPADITVPHGFELTDIEGLPLLVKQEGQPAGKASVSDTEVYIPPGMSDEEYEHEFNQQCLRIAKTHGVSAQEAARIALEERKALSNM